MESAMARIAPEGIELDGIYYDFDDTNRPQWLESKKVAATAGPCEQVRAHFDRMTVNWIYLVPKNPKWPIVQVPLSRLSRQWENYSRREYELAREFRTGAQKIARHHHDVRKIAFTQSLAAETAAAESAVRVKYGSLHRRNAVADSLGQQSAVREQISADAERDQLLHEAISTPRANCETATQANAMTYDNLLGLK
jgi:hypothetical protein